MAGTVADIRPRGLINVGNMRWANSVLLVLAYSSPFYRLFHTLGKAGVHLRGKIGRVRMGRRRFYLWQRLGFVGAFSVRTMEKGTSLVIGRGAFERGGGWKREGRERD